VPCLYDVWHHTTPRKRRTFVKRWTCQALVGLWINSTPHTFPSASPLYTWFAWRSRIALRPRHLLASLGVPQLGRWRGPPRRECKIEAVPHIVGAVAGREGGCGGEWCERYSIYGHLIR